MVPSSGCVVTSNLPLIKQLRLKCIHSQESMSFLPPYQVVLCFLPWNLSHVYNQLPLDEKAQELTTINTHKGLYQYTRLPFGVASAPAIFQRTMETLLKDLPMTCVYIDDILVAGKTPQDHLNNLAAVLNRLQEAGLRLKRV